MKRTYTDYLQDIVMSIQEIKSFIPHLSFKQFAQDRKTVNAVIRSLEVIGEAARKIPQNIKNAYPNVPWKKMSGMRDKILHVPKLKELMQEIKLPNAF